MHTSMAARYGKFVCESRYLCLVPVVVAGIAVVVVVCTMLAANVMFKALFEQSLHRCDIAAAPYDHLQTSEEKLIIKNSISGK